MKENKCAAKTTNNQLAVKKSTSSFINYNFSLSAMLIFLFVSYFSISAISVSQAEGMNKVSPTSTATDQGNQMSRYDRIVKVFNELRVENMSILNDFYADNVQFRDPLHNLSGLEAVKKYYSSLYKNVEEIRFDFSNHVQNGNTHVVVWQMTLRTKSLNGGNPFTLDGNSVIEFDPQTDKVKYHRDYFDMGEFIYEQIPVLGSIIKMIKARLKQ